MKEELYRLESVFYRYYADGEPVLRDINLKIPAIGISALVGPNGAGKTTLLKLLSRQRTPYRGSILYRGLPLRTYEKNDWAKRVAWLPQDPVLPYPMTVSEFVRLGCWPRRQAWFDSRIEQTWVAEALERLGITNLADRNVLELSGGERRLVHIARALAQAPETLLLDEPLTFLDFRRLVQVLDRLRILTETGINVVLILHDLNMVAHYADWVILLSEGCLLAAGSPSQVLTYQNLKTAYDTEVYIDLNDLTGKLIVLPLPHAEGTGAEKIPSSSI